MKTTYDRGKEAKRFVPTDSLQHSELLISFQSRANTPVQDIDSSFLSPLRLPVPPCPLN